MYLNLARKWRSKKFEEVIGQDFAIKVLKNCLYRNLISPVYLISGPKGCGKTTVARLFAAALNCENLSKFRENPKNISLPCASCNSCILFNKSAHPDFIEIDAASNTGVENVRQIIDSASFIPAIGVKRIYLIDEAHMLSKAAFNALLKTLEEPPASVLFILATTEVNKIIETVRSRCFQMFFMPIDKENLLNHLTLICKSEEIEFDVEALNLIVQESHGSARDALNLLEKVRAGFNVVNKESVFTALGLMPEEHLLSLLEILINQKPDDVMAFYNKHNLDKFDQFIIFKKLVNSIYSAIALKMNLISNLSEISVLNLKTLISACPLDLFINMLDLCYSFELILLKTANPAILIQNLLIKLCLVGAEKNSSSSNSSTLSGKTIPSITPKKIDLHSQSTKIQPSANKSDSSKHPNLINNTNSEWQTFLKELEDINDPLVLSIFKQGHFKFESNTIYVSFNKELIFFKDCLENAKSSWSPLLSKCFEVRKDSQESEIAIKFVFTADVNMKNTNVDQSYSLNKNGEGFDNQNINDKKIESNTKLENSAIPVNRTYKKFSAKVEIQNKSISIDLDKFKKVSIISKIFPGKVISSSAIENT